MTYLRVGTEEQNVESQRKELAKYAADRKWVIGEECSDVRSGTVITRSGLERVMDLVRTRAVDVVMVVKLDRLGRSLGHLVQMIDTMKARGVALVATSQGIDTSKSSPVGDLQMHVLGAVAQFERTLISERTKAGLVTARANGKILGRPSPTMVGNPREVVERWWNDTGGNGIGQLAEMLGGVSKATAWKWAEVKRKELASKYE